MTSWFELNPLQIELERYLRSKSPEAANIYLGALMVLNQDQNPDRVALSAYGFRELMKNLPNFINVPLQELRGKRLGDLVDTLTKHWEGLGIPSKIECKSLWSDEKTLGKIFGHVAELISANKKLQAARNALTKDIIRRRYFSEGVLPEHIEKIKVREWKSFLQSFNDTAHHDSTIDEEFEKTVLEFEAYLLTFFKPQSVAVQSEIEKAILEAEKS